MSINNNDSSAFRQTGWAGLRARLFHKYFLLRRAMTLGVRGMILDRSANTIFLVRHTYVPGWHLPGGGVELGETMEQALIKECVEEGNIRLHAAPELRSIHYNRNASNRDHVGFFVVEHFEQTGARAPDHEIAEARFFSLDALPENVTPATRRRIAEVLHGEPPSPYW